MRGGRDASTVAAEWIRLRDEDEAAGGGPRAPALVMGESSALLTAALESRGVASVRWSRFETIGQAGSPWPPEGPFGEVWVRMPASGREAEMLLHAAAARASRIFLYGANGDGIRSAAKRFPRGTSSPSVAAAKAHCRVLSARRRQPPPRPDGLGSWALDAPLDWGAGRRLWRHYPGVFAFGRVDPGTALLAGRLPRLPAGARLLDYGAGTGIVAAAAMERARGPISTDLLDHDAVALAAADANVRAGAAPHRATLVLGSGATAAEGPYDLVASNPPIHARRKQSTQALAELARHAPAMLAPRGRLVVVTQRRLPAGRMLAESFRRVVVVADRGPFRVWSASDARARRVSRSALRRRPPSPNAAGGRRRHPWGRSPRRGPSA